eukprot:m51a1_g12493 hypothetical protein (94) ;mRNA; r:2051-2332
MTPTSKIGYRSPCEICGADVVQEIVYHCPERHLVMHLNCAMRSGAKEYSEVVSDVNNDTGAPARDPDFDRDKTRRNTIAESPTNLPYARLSLA